MNEAPVWSPDGSQIAFVDCSKSGAAGVNCQIAVMSATGLTPRRQSEPTLSDQKPDSQRTVTRGTRKAEVRQVRRADQASGAHVGDRSRARWARRRRRDSMCPPRSEQAKASSSEGNSRDRASATCTRPAQGTRKQFVIETSTCRRRRQTVANALLAGLPSSIKTPAWSAATLGSALGARALASQRQAG